MLLVTSLFFSMLVAADQSSIQLPSGDEVVARMVARDNERQAALRGYTASRRYVLENHGHQKRAEMVVRVTCLSDGSKQFETISSTGWGGARKYVFPRLLEGEAEAARPGVRERSRIIPKNYTFEMVGTELLGSRPAYVLSIVPKTANKYLTRGRIWIDAEEYAIVRIEGKPAKNPSFWIKSVEFIHNYDKRDSFWFPVSDRSITDARIFGRTEVTIEYFDYVPNPPPPSAVANSSRSSVQLRNR